MNHQDEISAFLDAENSVTTRWLANTLRIDMTQARVALSKYKEDQPHVGVSYVVAGVGETSGLTYIIAEELDLDSVRGQFSSTRSEEIYAVHKIRSISNKAEMQALECDQASDLLYMTHPNSAEFYKNSIGHVVCPSMDVKPIGQRILSSKITVSSEQPSQVKEVIKTSVNKVLTPAAAPVAVAKSKSSIQATSFFGAATARPSKPTAETAPAVKEKSVEASPDAVKSEVKVQVKAEEEAPEAAPVKRVGRIACDDEDDEFDSEYKPDAARLKERVDAIAASSKTSVSMGAVEDSADVDVDMSEETEGGDAKAARKKGKQVVKHGAMDDYMEDIAIAAHNKAEATPADAPKPKKRKLVEKVRLCLFLVYFARIMGRNSASTCQTCLILVLLNHTDVC